MAVETLLYGSALREAAKPWLEELGKSDRARLETLLALSQTDKIRLSEVLEKLFPNDDVQTALANLTRLRNRVNEVAKGFGQKFQVDTKKKSQPTERAVWFTGPDATVSKATQFSRDVIADLEGRPFVKSKGIATTGSAMAAGKRVVRFFVSYARAQKDLADGLVEELKSQFGCSKRYALELWMDHDICIGEDWHDRIQAAIKASDFGLLLIGPEFLNRKYIKEHELPHYIGASSTGKPILPVGLIKVDFEHQDLLGLEAHQIFRKAGKNDEQRFYEEMSGVPKKREFVHQLFLAIQKRLDASFASGSPAGSSTNDGGLPVCEVDAEPEERQAGMPTSLHVHRFMRVPEETRHFQRTRGFAHHLSQRESLDPTKTHLGDARDALDEMEAWATRAESPPFFALLGEVGIGKTTTLKEFTRQLLDKRQKEPAKYPLPIYIDLRDYVADRPGAVPTIEELLTSVIQRAWRVTDRSITAAELLRLVREERAIIIFDGLDEKIVHLTQDRARDFIRTLWSVLPQAMLPRSGVVPSLPTSGKLLISCRSHYFRDVWSQNAMLTGEDREGIDRSHYPAFCLLPFNEEQIRNYLTSFLGEAKRGSEAFDLIASIHNLRDLAERPYLLQLISGRVNELEALQMRGETVNAARLYDLVVKSWLGRDNGKHQLDPAHKRRLMEELAATLWRSGEKQWDVDRLEEWFDEFLHQNPAVAYAYAGKDRSLLKEDLRTATFVLRPDTADSQFRFAHTSLQEYFLACYIVRALREKDDVKLDLPDTSWETLDFLGQLLALEKSPEALRSLERVMGGACLRAACLAFRYWLRAIEHGWPEPHPTHVNLSGAVLDEWRIHGRSKERPLDLRGASLRGVQLNRARVEHVDLSGADLSGMEARQALFLQVHASGAQMANADLAGLQWRGGSIENTALLGTHLDVAEWLGVAGGVPAPRAIRSMGLPRVYAAHCAAVNACAWGPLGTALLSASNDGTLKIWDAASGKELLSLGGHGAYVSCCAWSPDGTRLLSGSGDKTLKLWDVATGRELMTLAGHGASVSCCAWSPDGTRLLSGSEDNTLKLWDAATGRELMSLSGHRAYVSCCAWSPDGTRLLSGSWDNTLKLWDAATGREVLSLGDHGAAVSCCAWSPDGTRLLSGSWDNTLKLWDAATGRELLSLGSHGAEISCCAWSPDGTRLLSGSRDNTLKVWDAATGRELLTLAGHWDEVSCCAWSPDGTRLLSGSWDTMLKLWDAATGRELLSLGCHGTSVDCCAWSPDGTRLLFGSWDSTLKLWDAATGREMLTLAGHGSYVSCCAWSPDGTRLLSGSRDNTLKVWDAATGKELLSLEGHAASVRCCAWSPDGTRLLSGSGDTMLKLWDAATGRELLSLGGHGAEVLCCAWSPDGTRLLSGSWDRTLKLWDAATGRELLSLSGHRAYVSCCAWSPDGTRLLSGSGDKTLKLWDAATGRELHSLGSHGSYVSCCAWSPDGTRLLSGSWDKTLKLWDAATGRELLSLGGHGAYVICCGWSPDGTRLFSGSWDNTLKVWDAATGRELLSLGGHGATVSCCAWSPDGTRLFSGSGDKTLKLWDAATGECLWTGHMLPELQSAVIGGDGAQILNATAEAWRWLGWEERDARGRFIRRLPAEVFGPIPGMEE